MLYNSIIVETYVSGNRYINRRKIENTLEDSWRRKNKK